MKILNSLIWIILKNTRRYDKLKYDDDAKQTNQSLGIWSILSTLIGVAAAVLCVWAVSFLAEKTGSPDSLETILIIIGIFLLVVVLVSLVLQLIVNGLVCAILQMKLNKKPVGIISLVLWLAVIIAAAVIIIVVIF